MRLFLWNKRVKLTTNNYGLKLRGRRGRRVADIMNTSRANAPVEIGKRGFLRKTSTGTFFVLNVIVQGFVFLIKMIQNKRPFSEK